MELLTITIAVLIGVGAAHLVRAIIADRKESEIISRWLDRHKRVEDLVETEKSDLAERIRRSSVPYHEFARWEEEQRKKKD